MQDRVPLASLVGVSCGLQEDGLAFVAHDGLGVRHDGPRAVKLPALQRHRAVADQAAVVDVSEALIVILVHDLPGFRHNYLLTGSLSLG